MAKKGKRKKQQRHGARPIARPVTANAGSDLYQKGQTAFQAEDYAATVKAWRAAIRANPDTDLPRKLAEAHFRYALSLDRERKLTQIISELHQAIQRAPDVAIYRYHLGLAYHQKELYNKAIEAYGQALRLHPGDERFQTHLALACAESGQDVQDAVVSVMRSVQQEEYAEAHEILKGHPLGEIHGVAEGCVSAMLGEHAKAKRQLNQYTSTEYRSLASYYLGLIYAQEGKFPSAIKHLETAINEPHLVVACEPILLGVYKQQARAYAEAGEQAKANRLWNKIARLDPQDAAADNAIAAALQEGFHQASEGDFSKAMRSWRRLINKGFEHPALLQNYAIACDRSENYENAMETWQQLATVWEQQQSTAPDRKLLKRKLALVYRRIGEIAWHLDDIYESRDAYQKALAYVPEDLEIRLRLVTLLAEEGSFNAAIRQLRQLRRRHPDDIRVLELEITLRLESSDYGRALHACLDILKLDRKHQRALELLHDLGTDHVKTLLKENRDRQAIHLLESFMEVDGTHLPFYILLGGAFLEQNRMKKAEQVLAKCIEISEDTVLAHAQVGKAYMFAEYFDEAEAHFKEAGGLDSEEPDVLRTIGIAYMHHDAQTANPYLDKLIASQPEDEGVFEKMAQELSDSDSPDLAQKVLNRGLKVFPESIPLLISLIMTAIALEDFPLVRKTVKKARKLATAAGDFDTLQAISAVEMMLTFQESFGGFFDEYENFGKPF